MFRTKTDPRGAPLTWLAIAASIALHAVLLVGLAGVSVPLPAHHVSAGEPANASVVVQVESVDEVVLES